MTVSAARKRVLTRVASLLARRALPHPTRVGVDGVDGAGKTTFCDELALILGASGRPIIRASVDGFHHPASTRYVRGRQSPEGYFLDSFDYGALTAALLSPLGPGGSLRYRRAVFDYRRDTPVNRALEIASADSILLFDGIFLHRPELVGCFDVTVFLEVDFGVSMGRVAQRGGGSADVEAPANRRYVEGQRLYLRQCDPRNLADLVIDNNRIDRPKIVRGG